jgi:hypothetical protein
MFGTVALTNSTVSGNAGDGIVNLATLTLTNSTVFDNAGHGVENNSGAVTILNSTVSANRLNVWNEKGGTLTVINSTISDGQVPGDDSPAGGIQGSGHLTMVNSTVSGNAGRGVSIESTATLTSCTISGNDGAVLGIYPDGMVTFTNTVIDGRCDQGGGIATSNGYNIESPGNTCRFIEEGDQVSITESQLNLGELADNDGPAMTHKPGPGSAAIDQIPGDACDLTEDQRGQPRPETDGTMCDVGSVEVQPAP